MGGVGGREEEADGDEDDPVLGEAGGGGVGRGGAGFGEAGEDLERGTEGGTEYDWEDDYDDPDDETSVVILAPNITEGHILSSHNSEYNNWKSRDI